MHGGDFSKGFVLLNTVALLEFKIKVIIKKEKV
jgi:hypothetical protein